MASSSTSARRQTTVLVVDRGGMAWAAALCAMLGDGHNPLNANHVLRLVVTATVPSSVGGSWKCHEASSSQKWTLMRHWTTHMGAADAVFPMQSLDRAILGLDTIDDGGVASAILLCCSLQERQSLLTSALRTLYRLDDDPLFAGNEALLLSVVGPWRGFDWQCRRLFASGKPSSFVEWKRPLVLAGYRNWPWTARLVKSDIVLLLPQQSSGGMLAAFGSLKAEDATRVHRETAIHHLRRILPLPPSTPTDTTIQTPLQHPTKVPSIHGASLILQNSLLDANAIVHCCLAYAMSRNAMSSIGGLILDMLKEHHILAAEMLTTRIVHFPSLQASRIELMESVLGSHICHLTGNNSEEVLQRLDKSQAPFFYHGLLQYAATLRARTVLHMLATVLSPTLLDSKSSDQEKEVLESFLEDVPFGLCLALGMGELLGMDLPRTMPATLKVVRALQERHGKEYVRTFGSTGLVFAARDVGETMAPQAFGIQTVPGLTRFLRMSPLGENLQLAMESRLQSSPIRAKLMQSRL